MKLFNFWRRYPDKKPKASGFYYCSVAKWDGEDREVFLGRVLYYKESTGKWIDSFRQSVFDQYFVYRVEPKTEDLLLSTDCMCDWTEDVVAWKRVPRAKKIRRK